MLFGYHQFLLFRNLTTNEHLKGTYKKYGNPYTRGCCDNLGRICRKDKRNWKPEEMNRRYSVTGNDGKKLNEYCRRNSTVGLVKRPSMRLSVVN